MNSSYYYGSWMSDQRSNLLEFGNKEGFVFTNYRLHRSFDIQISLFDGFYIDQDSIALYFDFNANMPSVNPDNGLKIKCYQY